MAITGYGEAPDLGKRTAGFAWRCCPPIHALYVAGLFPLTLWVANQRQDQGQGANQAIEDAATMAVVFPRNTCPADVPERLKLYEEIRYERAHKIQSDSRRAGSDWKDGKPQVDRKCAILEAKRGDMCGSQGDEPRYLGASTLPTTPITTRASFSSGTSGRAHKVSGGECRFLSGRLASYAATAQATLGRLSQPLR